MVKFLIALSMVGVAAPALAAEPNSQPAAPAEEKKVCKRIADSASLVRKTKVCLTRAQWKHSADGHRGYAQEMQDALRTRPAGGQ